MEVVAGLLRTMHNIHTAGFVHLDIKPDNIAVLVNDNNYDSAVTILDFGVASRVTNVIYEPTGTEGWMAPEMEELKWTEKINLKLANIWSIGKVLLSMAHSPCSFDEEQRNLVLMLGRNMTSRDPESQPALAELLCQVPCQPE
ncbi:hypothetical protein E1B28_009672 [Marasmius oreades]|uniref:Protein kinase domain-containing protein n=1 Tax=Marasmius oreades TaxID=181124 RepID=A0A9P7RVJ0_9AGAR|nr:uncharacterized protein E1B28_009672 [Marasmius oreades]KAG7090564.1 hypothetical protein E1B28_009672 [Marasmius oreades]